jgi:hypothetical protein
MASSRVDGVERKDGYYAVGYGSPPQAGSSAAMDLMARKEARSAAVLQIASEILNKKIESEDDKNQLEDWGLTRGHTIVSEKRLPDGRWRAVAKLEYKQIAENARNLVRILEEKEKEIQTAKLSTQLAREQAQEQSQASLEELKSRFEQTEQKIGAEISKKEEELRLLRRAVKDLTQRNKQLELRLEEMTSELAESRAEAARAKAAVKAAQKAGEEALE